MPQGQAALTEAKAKVEFLGGQEQFTPEGKELWIPPCLLQGTDGHPGLGEATDIGAEAEKVRVPGDPNPRQHLSLGDWLASLVQKERSRAWVLGMWGSPPPSQPCTPTCCVPDLEVQGFAVHLQINRKSLKHSGGVALRKKGTRWRL